MHPLKQKLINSDNLIDVNKFILFFIHFTLFGI